MMQMTTETLALQDEEVATVSPDFPEQTAKPTQLPVPKGYQILIALPEPEEKTEGGIVKPESAKHTEMVTSIVGFVLAMGDDCYKDRAKFPSGAYCKEGDFVLFHAYSGTRLAIHGKEFRLIADEAVRAVVDDPRGITRAG